MKIEINITKKSWSGNTYSVNEQKKSVKIEKHTYSKHSYINRFWPMVVQIVHSFTNISTLKRNNNSTGKSI